MRIIKNQNILFKKYFTISFMVVFFVLTSLIVFSPSVALAACASDADCDDGSQNTSDTCSNPGTSSSSCSNLCLNDYACEPSEKCEVSIGICVGVSPSPCQNDAECVHQTRVDVIGKCENPNTSDPTASKVCLFTKNTNIAISACSSAADCPVGKICENPGAPNSACVDPPTVSPPTSGSVPNSKDLLGYIAAIVLMIAGVKFTMTAVGEASKIADTAVSKATGGKVKSVGAGAKMAVKGAAAGTALGAKAFAGADLSKMKEDTRLQKAIKGAVGLGQKATMAGINTAAIPGAAARKVKDWGAGRKKKIEEDFEKAQKNTKTGAWATGKSAEELSGKNEKVEKIANDNMNRDVESIKRDMAKEMEKGANADLQKVNGLALALKNIKDSKGSGSPTSAKGAEQQKQAEELIKELEAKAGIDMSKGVDFKVANGLVNLNNTASGSQYVRDMQRAKYQGKAEDLISDFSASGFDDSAALEAMSNEDILRAEKNLGSYTPNPADPVQVRAHADAVTKISALKTARINNIQSDHQAMLNESINNPALTTVSQKRQVKANEQSKLNGVKSSLGYSGGAVDIRSARESLTKLTGKDMSNASLEEMKMIVDTRQSALTSIII